MSSHRRNKNNRKLFAFLFVVVLLAGVFGVNYATGDVLSNTLRNAFVHVFAAKNITATSLFDAVGNSFKTKQKILEERNVLQERVDALQNIKYENNFLRAQNDALSELLTGAPAAEGKMLLADVFSVSGVLPYGSVLLRTESKTVRIGDVVVAKGGIALGHVASTMGKSVTVRLFSAAGRSIDVLIGLGEEAVAAEAQGLGSGNFAIVVPRDATVRVGDPVFARSAFGYQVGVVGEVETDPTDAFLMVRARVPVNVGVLRSVLIRQ